jgi:glycosyltransferase involved in cell wall biosynthesis
MMRWGRSLCDGLAEVRKCAACDLQKRGLPVWAARTAACLPVPVSEALRNLPGKLGTTLGMPSAIAFNRTRQAELIDLVDRFVLLTAWALDAAARNGAPRRKLALNRLGISGAFARKPDAAAQPTPSPVRFGYVGRFDPIKGVHDLARAVAALPRDTPFSLDIRGPLDTAEGRDVHRRMQAAIGSDPRVTFGAPIAPDAVPEHLRSIDVLCCPSICLEGGPTVAIEAQAAGTPVLGTRIGGLAELVTDGVDGRLVEPGDWRALASAFADIASDPGGTVDRWRDRIPPARSMDDVTADYLGLYAA